MNSCTLVKYRDKSGFWRWRLRDTDKNIVCVSSKNFSSERACDDNFGFVRTCKLLKGE